MYPNVSGQMNRGAQEMEAEISIQLLFMRNSKRINFIYTDSRLIRNTYLCEKVEFCPAKLPELNFYSKDFPFVL